MKGASCGSISRLFTLPAACVAVAALAGQSSDLPEWQNAAGGKAAFEVASVKPDKGEFRPPAFPLDNGNAYAKTSGRFSADFPLITYIQFAYKVRFTQQQLQSMLLRLPKWITSDRFEIDARAPGLPTKDQMRLMVQSLLADRFHLAVHFETQETAVLALTLVKPGKTGPKLLPHSEGPPCDDAQTSPAQGRSGAVLPSCGSETLMMRDHKLQAASRNTTIDLLAESLTSLGRLDRPVVNRTGLSGSFDYDLEWFQEQTSAGLPGANPQADAPGPTFLEALREQLGLKLESSKAPILVLVVDHVERPSEN